MGAHLSRSESSVEWRRFMTPTYAGLLLDSQYLDVGEEWHGHGGVVEVMVRMFDKEMPSHARGQLP